MFIFRKKRTFWKIALGLLLILGVISFLSHVHYRNYKVRPVKTELFDSRFDGNALNADVDFMLKTFEAVHPNLYAHISRDSVFAVKNLLLSRITRKLTRTEFFPVVARIAAIFRDGHTVAVVPREEMARYSRQGGRWFPFSVFTITENGLQVKHVLQEDSPIKTGDWILAVNGHPVDSLFRLFSGLVSAETPHLKAHRVRSAFQHYLWLHGIDPPYTLQWRRNDSNAIQIITVEGVTEKEFQQFYRQKRPIPSPKDYSFRWLDGDIGYLDFRRMRRPEAFETFLEETFTAIQQKSAAGLIIDLRNNGGGASSLGNKLLTYITEKPYRLMARWEWKMTKQIKNGLKTRFLPTWLCWIPVQYLFADGRRIWGTPNGKFLNKDVPLTYPSENPLRYSGPVCVLIGPRTFSSAQKLANAIKDYQLAVLIGEETGGVPNAFGEIYMFRLPNTQLLVGVSTKRFIRANGDTGWTRGILPDIEIQQNIEDVRKGVDTVLEFARGWCIKQTENS